MPEAEWMRVSTRARWHVVTRRRPGNEAYETACGRVQSVGKTSSIAWGERPGPVCDKCREAVRLDPSLVR